MNFGTRIAGVSDEEMAAAQRKLLKKRRLFCDWGMLVFRQVITQQLPGPSNSALTTQYRWWSATMQDGPFEKQGFSGG